MPFYLQAIAHIATPETIWPVSVAGWFGLVSAVAALILAAYNKLIAQANHKKDIEISLNEFGKRMKSVEDENKTALGERKVQSEQINKVLNQHEVLLRTIGQATGESARCREDYDALAEKFDKRFEKITESITDLDKNISKQLSYVAGKMNIDLPQQ